MKITVRSRLLALFVAGFVAIPVWAQSAATAAAPAPNTTYAIKGGKVFTSAGRTD